MERQMTDRWIDGEYQELEVFEYCWRISPITLLGQSVMGNRPPGLVLFAFNKSRIQIYNLIMPAPCNHQYEIIRQLTSA
jgi:hypothetical protein